MSFASIKPIVHLAATGLLLCTSAADAGEKPLTPQSAVAFEFLHRLETGRTAEAHKLLESQVARMYPPSKLVPAVGRSKAPKVRQIRSERAIVSTEAYANRINPRYASLKRGTRPTYLVCMADVPRSGYGRVSYVAVILVANPGTADWKVSEYRYQSEPEQLCRS